MLYISIKFIKCTSRINTCLFKSDIVRKWEKLNCCYTNLKQHTIEDAMHEDEKETLDIVDGPCLIPDIEKYLEQPFEIIYE